jgi:glycosyltransferase involved in cell wall biosynthesis
VSILSPDLAGNALGRAYVLAKLLQDDFSVSIIAHGEGKVWEPVRQDTSIEYRAFFHRWVPGYCAGARKTIRRLIDGDLIFAVKPLLPSFGIGLYARRLLSRPLLLDIDDWEIGFLSDSLYWEARLLRSRWLFATQSPLYTRVLNRIIRSADATTVSNRFLQERYGGCWVPHARDESLFSANKPHDVGSEVIFLGTARLNKGLDILLEAWKTVARADARLRIIGTPPDDPIIQGLRDQADSRVSFEGPVPFAFLPGLLASARVVVIPQQAMRGSLGQLPAKLIDAMAAGRPVVSTIVGDIPAWLSDGAGIVVPPGDPAALGAAIERVLDDPAEAELMGQRARARFLRYGSFTAVRERLLPLVQALIAGRRLPSPYAAFGDFPEAGNLSPGASVPADSCASCT